MSNKVIQHIALMSCSIFFTLLACETGLRVFQAVHPFIDRYKIELQTQIYAAHPFLNHTLAPSLNGIRPAHTDVNIPAYRLETNTLGFRFNMERFDRKNPGTFRIAVLGDSQIEGYQLESTLPELLEKELNRTAGGNSAEVMNFGVMSYSPIIHYINIRNTVLMYKPDMVILYFDMTDVFDDNMRYRNSTAWDAAGNPVSVRPSANYAFININGKQESIITIGRDRALSKPFDSAVSLTINAIERSYLIRLLYFRLKGPQKVFDVYKASFQQEYPDDTSVSSRLDIGKLHEWCWDYDSPEIQRQIDFSFSILAKIRTLLAANDIPLIIVSVPVKSQLAAVAGDRRYLRSMDRLESFCRSSNIPFWAPVEDLERAVREKRAVYLSDNMHLSSEGQKLWAATLLTHIYSSLRAGSNR